MDDGVQIALAAPVDVRNTLAAQGEHLAALRALRDFEVFLAAEDLNLDGIAERGSRCALSGW